MCEFFAHSTDDESRENWHLLRDHLIATGEMAARFGAPFGIGRAAQLAGLLHDLGKYSEPFQARLRGESVRVDHATAGAQEIKKLVENGQEAVIAELIAFAIAGHHAGLANRTGVDGSLEERLRKVTAPLDPVWSNEIAPVANNLLPTFAWSKETLPFQLAFLGRMIFSCLVDADFRDTEAFYSRIEGKEPDRYWPALGGIINDLIAAFDAYMSAKESAAPPNDVNRLRADILAHARGHAGDSPGFFTLTVPTGGGKTLTSLGFALDHARHHGLERIIYAIPFTSIIDQTAAIFRDVLGADHVLEHHAAIDEDRLHGLEQRDKLRLAMEDWAAPVIVTTNVQFFESLYANRPSRCRKLHNIARSVIVLDEAQTIPRPLLRPCIEALRELVVNYSCSIVLCTATQPALAAPAFPGGLPLEKERELAPDPPALAKQLKRVRIEMGDALSNEELVAALAGTPQGLVILNTRKHALAVFRAAAEAGLDGAIHLTTRQYAAHRQRILACVRQRLKDGLPCRLIATSLVEAGVDLDFPRVWRAEAGLEQIAQAAGRCNREGRRAIDESTVTVFKAPEYPPPFEVRKLAEDFMRMAGKHTDWLTPDAIRDYFAEVYWRLGERLDAEGILAGFRLNGAEADFAYRSVARKFRMIRSGMVPVIVAREAKAREALEQLGFDGARAGSIARKLQPFLVQVPPRARAKLLAAGHAAFAQEARFGDQFCVLLSEGLYRDDTGLLWEDAECLQLEDSII
ncbi:MAG: CRISPR-associated endonuclease Cas3'' [Rhodothalassiaceae bacterium]